MFAASPAQDRWCDVEGFPIDLFCLVQQVAESTEPTVLPSRLHQHGQVVGRGLEVCYVRFSDNALVSVPPAFLRLLPEVPEGGGSDHGGLIACGMRPSSPCPRVRGCGSGSGSGRGGR